MTENSTHMTLGRPYRFPAHPDVVTALGRAVFNWISLEDIVSAILYEGGWGSLPEARGLMAGAKAGALNTLAKQYRRRGEPTDEATAQLLRATSDEFKALAAKVRNHLFHSHPFTSTPDADGNYVPGLSHVDRDGGAWQTIAENATDLLDLATRIEALIGPLGAARAAVALHPVERDAEPAAETGVETESA